MALAFVGLGSNLADPELQLRTALIELASLPQSRCLGQSSLYRSTPLRLPDSPGKIQDQPDYLNAVAVLDTELSPTELLTALQSLENQHHRQRAERWGPRTLDLDLLLYGNETIETAELTVPHPGLYERNFVLYPLAELADKLSLEVQIPGRGTLADVLSRCDAGSPEKLK